MTGLLDMLVWLIDLPVRRGVVFLAWGFLGGLGALLLLRATGARSDLWRLPGSTLGNRTLTAAAGPVLAAARERAGLTSASGAAPTRRRSPGSSLVRIGAAALLVLLGASGLLGLIGITGVPVTRAYIAAHGEETPGQVRDGWVVFTASDGQEHILRSDTFPPITYPGDDAVLSDQGGPVTVRYLASHPQAFVILTTDRAATSTRSHTAGCPLSSSRGELVTLQQGDGPAR
ncbi:hypothetical protein [Brachybacterium hainanense]|uniref:Uncharacterized protein n=1 Tax=Brachybacterium hainanense TaxID=1541174 RepID=A0ABV6RD75_9MICO